MAMFNTDPFDGVADLPDLGTTLISPPCSLDLEPQPATTKAPKSRKRRQSSISKHPGGKDQTRMLACLTCRQKKIKCYRESSTCGRCERLQIMCIVPEEDERLRPSSKNYIKELEKRIETLQKKLEEAEEVARRNLYLTPPDSSLSSDSMDITLNNNNFTEAVGVLDSEKTPQTLIARLIAEKSQFHADEHGQVRFFGPNSSLHTNEKASSTFVKWDDGRLDVNEQDDIAPMLRDHLLEQYWRFQHTVLQVVHREAFLQDMQAGRSRYFSKALLYAILANAAVFSEAPEIRALVLSKDDDPEGSKPYLLRKASELVELEVETDAGVTTIQSLQLLSSVHCRRGADTKGWLESGRACRLIFELGLHKDDTEFYSSRSSPMDLEVRRVVFWGCFTYERGWAVYLGRPSALNLEDVTISAPSILSDKTSSYSAELSILLAWTTLFTIVGDICNALNKMPFTNTQMQNLRQTLLAWQSNLDPSLMHVPGCPPAVSVLQLQFHAAMILLHRSTARFGTSQEATPISQESRAVCVEHVLQIATILDDYRRYYGSAMTLLGLALYNITVAAVVLIAIRAEQASEASNEYLSSLTSCIGALEEMQTTFVSAKTILKQLRYLVRRCKLLDVKGDSQALKDANASLLQRRGTMDPDADSPPVRLIPQILQQEWSTSDATALMDSGEFMLALEDCAALQTMGSWNDFETVFV